MIVAKQIPRTSRVLILIFFFSFLNRLLVTEWRRLSHLFTRHIIHCAYVTYRSSMLDVRRVNQVPPTILQ